MLRIFWMSLERKVQICKQPSASPWNTRDSGESKYCKINGICKNCTIPVSMEVSGLILDNLKHVLSTEVKRRLKRTVRFPIKRP